MWKTRLQLMDTSHKRQPWVAMEQWLSSVESSFWHLLPVSVMRCRHGCMLLTYGQVRQGGLWRAVLATCCSVLPANTGCCALGLQKQTMGCLFVFLGNSYPAHMFKITLGGLKGKWSNNTNGQRLKSIYSISPSISKDLNLWIKPQIVFLRQICQVIPAPHPPC